MVHDIRLQELRLYTDFGRCCRPLFIVDQQRLKVPSHPVYRHHSSADHPRMPTPGLVELKYMVF